MHAPTWSSVITSSRNRSTSRAAAARSYTASHKIQLNSTPSHPVLARLQRLLAATKTVQSELWRGRDSLDRLRARHDALLRRLLAVAAKVETLAASATPENSEERALRDTLGGLLGSLRGSGGGGDLLARVAALETSQRMREEFAASASGRFGSSIASSSSRPAHPALADSADLKGILNYLEQQRSGIEQLISVVTRDARDLRIARDGVEAESARVAVGAAAGGGRR